MADNKLELLVCVINSGFSGELMKAAKNAGCKGGTVIHAHGTANKQAEKFFNISIQPEKDMVLIIVRKEIRDDVIKAINDAVGFDTDGKGIVFTVPVEDAVGVKV